MGLSRCDPIVCGGTCQGAGWRSAPAHPPHEGNYRTADTKAEKRSAGPFLKDIKEK